MALPFLASKSKFFYNLNQYVILGVTGPNEYKNNVNNNFYTNYIAKWCLEYYEQIQKYPGISIDHKEGEK
jgi:maltose phosphorylase